MNSTLFRLKSNDFVKGAFIAVLTGFFVPFVLIVQEPVFSLATADWPAILNLGLNSAFAGFVSYLAKNFLSDENGKILGKI